MLVVKLEVHQGGDGRRVEKLGELRIGNLSDLAAVSDYSAELVDPKGKVVATGGVRGYARGMGAWRLALRALAAMASSLPAAPEAVVARRPIRAVDGEPEEGGQRGRAAG